MADTTLLQPFTRTLVLRLGAVLLAVCLLLWGAWVSREVARPREQIVTVRLSETIARFVDAEARSGKAPEDGQARTLAYLQAAEAAVREMCWSPKRSSAVTCPMPRLNSSSALPPSLAGRSGHDGSCRPHAAPRPASLAPHGDCRPSVCLGADCRFR